jgi:hypothetical protein
VERQDKTEAWQPAKIGTQYFIGDAAKTGDGSGTTATLVVGGPRGAHILMKKNTVLRFSGTGGKNKISVEDGEIELSSSYSLDFGDVDLSRGGKAQITANNGRASVELTTGEGKVVGLTGVVNLRIGEAVPLDKDGTLLLDAGVPDARVAPPDAGVDAPGAGAIDQVSDATLEVTGRRAELLAAGETAWKPLAAGGGRLARGSAIRLGAGTTAKVTAGGATVDLAGGARMKLGDDLVLALEAGAGTASAEGPATIALPGGAIALAGSSRATSEARLDSNNRETRVSMQRGGSKLTGAAGSELQMNRGETALLARAGAIRIIESIPSRADVHVPAGESFTIHDPSPPAAVQFQFEGKCPDGGIVELARDGRFRTPKVSGGQDLANLRIGPGEWTYRLRCIRNGADGPSVASGRIIEQQDDGRRPLQPKGPSLNDIDADGRKYTIYYQSAIPNLVVHVRNPGATHKLHLAAGGKEQTFDSSTPSIIVPGSQLREGKYTYWIDRDGIKQDKVSDLNIKFDQSSPQVYIEAPANGQRWAGDVDVHGAVLPGWSAVIEGIPLPIDDQRRFKATVGVTNGKPLAIRLAHPQRGIHYYLRRPKAE